MKAEINSKNKAKFFALYWGQEVIEVPHLIYSGFPPEPSHEEWGVEKLNSYYFQKIVDNDFPLLLKPLSSISDEDIKNVCIIEGYIHEENSFGQIIRSKATIGIQIIDNDYPSDIPQRVLFYLSHVFFIEWDNMQSYEDNQTQGVSPNAYDYLRSKGYALPWLGISVDEMVEAGWIKLAES